MTLNKSHPIISKYRLMKEFGWTPSQLDELDSKFAEQILFLINRVDKEVERKLDDLERKRKEMR